MTDDLLPGRRGFLIGAASAGLLSGPAFALARQPRFTVKVASNQGVENSSLQQLMADRGFARALSLDVQIVESKTINGPMDAILAGEADICMVSGFVGVLPAIEQGREMRLVGAAMNLPALAVYTRDTAIRRVEDLAGRTFGVGGMNGLLHVLALALLRKKGVDTSSVKFVNVGSNAQVLEAVAAGKVDAGLSGPAGLTLSSVRVLDGGRLWEAVPEYTYQPAYASVRALKEKPEALARCVAAYTRLYRYMSGPSSKAAYLAARHKAANEPTSAEGESVWNFIRTVQPYALQPGLTPQRVAYLQELNVALGLQKQVLPYDRVVDTAPARGAKTFLT